jgi:hypothetical protein
MTMNHRRSYRRWQSAPDSCSVNVVYRYPLADISYCQIPWFVFSKCVYVISDSVRAFHEWNLQIRESVPVQPHHLLSAADNSNPSCSGEPEHF